MFTEERKVFFVHVAVSEAFGVTSRMENALESVEQALTVLQDLGPHDLERTFCSLSPETFATVARDREAIGP